MARMTYVSEDLEQIEFAKKAAEHFALHPEHSSFGDLTPGSFIALRWGIGEDCIHVLKIDENHVPVIYQQIIKKGDRTL